MPSSVLLNAPLLWRAAAVVRNRGHVRDAGDLQTGGVQRPHCRLASRPWPRHPHLDVLDAVFLSNVAGLLGGHLRRERRALARATEPTATRGRPRECVPLAIGDGDDRVVE